jgi:hypothetical protein
MCFVCNTVGVNQQVQELAMRPTARGLAQHGGPNDWLEESDPEGCDFVRDGQSMPPALTDHTTCSGLGLINLIYY